MKNKMFVPVLLCAVVSALIITCGCTAPMQTAQGKQLTVFAAASLTDAFTEIGQSYHAQHPDINVSFNFDGSQILRTQIEQGAYADVFASANMRHMNALRDEGLMNNSSVTVFAKNKLAIIVPKANHAHVSNVSDLARPEIKLVIGTKDTPCGEYTLQMLSKTANDTAYGPEYKNRVLANVVSQEPNVDGIVTKVVLGEADAGIVTISDVSSQYKDKVEKVMIPDTFNIVAQYPIGVISGSKNAQQAQNFVDLVNSPAGQAVLQKYRFIVLPRLTSQNAIMTGVTSQRTTAMT